MKHWDIPSRLKDFYQIKHWEKQTAKRFIEHPFFELTYEELTADSQKMMNKIYSFFDLKSHPVTTNMHRQNAEKMEDLINNYDEVAAALIDAGYADF